MKFCEYLSLLEDDPAEIALLSTFNFEPDFFERRILRSSTLSRARRIVVFMDHGQWERLRGESTGARWINHKYLVVPVRAPRGVFHPKLTLIVRDGGGTVLCGSGNLTRCGCTHNLEIVSALPVNADDEGDEESLRLGWEAFRFFRLVASQSEGVAAEITRQWLDEVVTDVAWCRPMVAGTIPERKPHEIGLIHTLDGSIWDRLKGWLNGSVPHRLVVISPFYDPTGELIKRAQEQWPQSKIEIVAQQGTSNIPVEVIRRWKRSPALFDVRSSSRRLHGKMLAWESEQNAACLVGSANFTCAAFDGRNIEVCLLIPGDRASADDLFDGQLPRKPVTWSSFVAGTDVEPAPVAEAQPELSMQSAVLTSDDKLRVAYRCSASLGHQMLSVALRVGDEQHPRATMPIRWSKSAEETMEVPGSVLADLHGSMQASLVTQFAGQRLESTPVWVILKDRLTHEPAEGAKNRSKREVEDSGEGLAEFLDDLAKREGLPAMIEYLNRLNIRFQDGSSGVSGHARFRLKRSDPFQPDVQPEWWDQLASHGGDLEQAIYAFVERHEKKRLRRHAERGNINGMENFVDIVTAMVRLLYVYHVRGVVKPEQLIGRICQILKIASMGIDTTNDYCEGYLNTLASNLAGDKSLLRDRCEQTNLTGNLEAALLIVQFKRYDPNEFNLYGSKLKSPRQCLPHVLHTMRSGYKVAGLKRPAAAKVADALKQYRMMSDDDIQRYVSEYE